NAGIFLMRADTVLEELDRFEPEIAAASRRAFEAADGGPRLPAELYARIPSAPIDKAVMERSRRVAVAPCDPGWSDVGSWHALWELGARDERGNLGRGDVHLEEVSDCLVEARERLVVLAGVRDLAVVETADAVLVAGREASDAIKRAVAALAREGRPEVERHVAEPRAWGEERRVAERPGYRVREYEVQEGARLGLTDRSAVVRLVVSGVAGIAGGDAKYGPGTLLPVGGTHELEVTNAGGEPLRLLEIAIGAS
ncbi:MAG TPA: mannose-1-phosphate guanylyltransferase/mannose-6-phosphate isomerase, partial [Rhodospirillales bacterium]|nr:mannose-1-phosphate guanylyltransferase/mannose-6-phosphate isomerase [Rhodospirillales bacterium]